MTTPIYSIVNGMAMELNLPTLQTSFFFRVPKVCSAIIFCGKNYDSVRYSKFAMTSTQKEVGIFKSFVGQCPKYWLIILVHIMHGRNANSF